MIDIRNILKSGMWISGLLFCVPVSAQLVQLGKDTSCSVRVTNILEVHPELITHEIPSWYCDHLSVLSNMEKNLDARHTNLNPDTGEVAVSKVQPNVNSEAEQLPPAGSKLDPNTC